MQTPQISIIVPCYNVEKYIDQCVDSLVHQSLKTIEIILVDDCSPDSVPAKCDSWAQKDARIRVIHRTENGGLGESRNTGLNAATGEYVAFLDSDDFVKKDMYSRLYNCAIENGSDVCYCGYSYYDGDKIIPQNENFDDVCVWKGRKEVDRFMFDMLGMPTTYPRDGRMNMCVWRAIYSRKIIIEKNVRFVSERKYASEDIHFHASFLPYAQNVCLISDYLHLYRYNPNSISNSYPDWKRNALLNSNLQIKEEFSKFYTVEQYWTSYQRLCFRNLKAIVIRENLANVTFTTKRKKLYGVITDRCFDDLFDGSFKYFRLPLFQIAIFLFAKYRFTSGLIFLYSVKNAIKH